MFFCCGNVEEKGILETNKGHTYKLKVDSGSGPTCKLDQGSNVLFGGGAVRIGEAKVIDADEEVRNAAAFAKDADQVIICAGLNVDYTMHRTIHIVKSSLPDWEGVGTDRSIFSLPDHMDALITTMSAALQSC